MSGRRSFWGNESGATAPLFALALVALVASGGVAWDISRGYALRGELDAAADAAALAGATQLDGASGAQARALTAAQGGLVANSQRLADAAEANVAAGGASITFLSSISPHTAATGDADARFVQVDVTPRDLGFIFGAWAQVTGAQVVAHAVAGYGSGICKVPPLMICNPNETASLSFDGDQYIGKVFMLTPPPGGNAAWGPGNFGFLRVGNGASAIQEAMGRNPPLAECFGNVAETEPGNIANADDWFNTRFDIYRAGAGGRRNDPLYAPALNTIIGTQTNSGNPACAPTVNAPSNNCASGAAIANGTGLPRDCGQTSTVGSGVWNAAQYFNTNHNGINPATYTPATPSNAAFAGAGWSAYGPAPVAGATTPTRFQVYNWELAMLNAAGGNGRPSTPMAPNAFSQGQALSSGSRDYARPICNTTNANPPAPDRRTISAVIVNCRADNVHGRSTVHVIAYLDLFLIAPAVSQTIYGEAIGATTDVSAVGKETRKYSVRLYE